MDDNQDDMSGADSPQTFRGSAWAAVDETFFGLVRDTFSDTFSAGSDALLAANDETSPPEVNLPTVIRLPEQPDEDAARALRASIRRHPSSWRRF